MSQHDPLRCMLIVEANLGISYNALEQDDLGRVVIPCTESRCEVTHWTAEAITNMMYRDYIDSQTYTVSTIASLALRHCHHLHKHGLLLNRECRRRCLVQIAVLILECCEVHHQLSNKCTRKKKNRQETHFPKGSIRADAVEQTEEPEFFFDLRFFRCI